MYFLALNLTSLPFDDFLVLSVFPLRSLSTLWLSIGIAICTTEDRESTEIAQREEESCPLTNQQRDVTSFADSGNRVCVRVVSAQLAEQTD
jgi:hypothetical protein